MALNFRALAVVTAAPLGHKENGVHRLFLTLDAILPATPGLAADLILTTTTDLNADTTLDTVTDWTWPRLRVSLRQECAT